MLISPDYQSVLKAMHARETWGNKGHKHIELFWSHYQSLGAHTILDYGSGTESLRQELEKRTPPVPVACYDPGVIGREALPEPADYLVCTDVLEHIEPENIGRVLDHMVSVTLKGAYLNVALTRAKRFLPDGRNAHILLLPPSQWFVMMTALPWRIVRHETGQKTVKFWINK